VSGVVPSFVARADWTAAPMIDWQGREHDA
jgi:hypothetical protein